MKPSILFFVTLVCFIYAMSACKKKNDHVTTSIDTYITKTYTFNVLKEYRNTQWITIHDSISGHDSTYTVTSDTSWWAIDTFNLQFNATQVVCSRFQPSIAYKTGDHYEGKYSNSITSNNWSVYSFLISNDSVYMSYGISSYSGPNASNYSKQRYFSIKK